MEFQVCDDDNDDDEWVLKRRDGAETTIEKTLNMYTKMIRDYDELDFSASS